ncbi:MAG: hypothetical protein RL885_30860 [Planctomycetota bacterium]
MRRTDDWSVIEWLRTDLEARQSPNDPQLRVCQRLPESSEVLKILHPIFEDPTIEDPDLTWNDAGDAEGTKGERVPWSRLAKEKGLELCAEISEWSFLPYFDRGWPRRLVGPDEGNLEPDHCLRLAALIEEAGLGGPCSFFFALPATTDWESEQLWQGELRELGTLLDADDVWCSPTLWVPDDRRWCVTTDYEQTFSLICGPELLIRIVAEDALLETVPLTWETRLDSSADETNRPGREDDGLVTFG